MGGSIPMPAEWVFLLVVLWLLPLPFIIPAAMRIVAGPRDRLFIRGLKTLGFTLLCVVGGFGVGRLIGYASLPLTALAIVYGFKESAETTWPRATLGVVLSVGLFAVVGYAWFR